MSKQAWHQCDFPKCGRNAVWCVVRPGHFQNDCRNIALPQFEEWCIQHAYGLMENPEQFIADAKAAL